VRHPGCSPGPAFLVNRSHILRAKPAFGLRSRSYRFELIEQMKSLATCDSVENPKRPLRVALQLASYRTGESPKSGSLAAAVHQSACGTAGSHGQPFHDITARFLCRGFFHRNNCPNARHEEHAVATCMRRAPGSRQSRRFAPLGVNRLPSPPRGEGGLPPTFSSVGAGRERGAPLGNLIPPRLTAA